MARKARIGSRRESSLSRQAIIEAAIELLDKNGEEALTFRALSAKLSTGPGAIYWHVANRSDLLISACDAVLSAALDVAEEASPRESVRLVALRIFDLIDEHPWVSAALRLSMGQMPTVRVLEHIGQQVMALQVPESQQWYAAGAIFAYILGVSVQNSANTSMARAQGLERSAGLAGIASTWSQLDPDLYPFTHRFAVSLANHDDREDYLAGLDLLLDGIEATR